MSISKENIVKSSLASFDIPNISMAQLIKQNIERIVASNKDKSALIRSNDGKQLTFEQLNKKAQNFASNFLQQNIEISSHDAVMFFGENSFDYVISMLAMIYLGVPVILIAPSYGPYELHQQMVDTEATILCVAGEKLATLEKMMTNSMYQNAIKNLKLIITFDDAEVEDQVNCIAKHSFAPKNVLRFERLKDQNDSIHIKLLAIPHLPIDPKTSWFLTTFTSGTTSKAKGIIHTHHSMVSCILDCELTKFEQIISKSIMNLHPLGHMSGNIQLLRSLCTGFGLVIMDKSATNEDYLAAVEKHRITTLVLSLSLAMDLLNESYATRYDLSSLRVMVYGGSKLSEDVFAALQAKYRVPVLNVYGASEFMGSLKHVGSFPVGSLGQPNANVEMKIVHMQTGATLPVGAQGEVCFRGPQCFAGYVKNLEAYREAVDSEGWYHSGDMGFCDSNGTLHFVDRRKEAIKYKCDQISPAEIETFLLTHPAVKEVCVVGVPHKTECQHARAYVLPVEGQSATEDEIVKYAQDNIVQCNWLYAGVRFVTEMPHLLIGKIDRQYFKNLVKDELLTAETADY